MLPDLSLSLGRGSSFGLNALQNATRAPQRTMTPEEEDSIAWKVGRAGISGLAAVGNLLDLPVSSVRDTLAGENPLDQWLTPFSDANRVSARDLLRRNGMIGKKDTWGNFFGGMAVDYALDPLTYVSFGTSAMAKAALTKSGKIFQRIGGTAGDVAQLTAKGVGPRIGLGTTTLKAFLEHGDEVAKAAKKTDALEAAKKLGYSLDDEILNQPLRQMGGWGIPWTEIGGTFGDLRKEWGVARGIAYGMDAIGEAVKYSAPGRFFNMLLDPEAGGYLDGAQQALNRAKHGERHRAAAIAAKNGFETGKVVNDAFEEFKSAYGDQFDDLTEEGGDPLAKALDLFNRVSRFTSETGDYDEALKLVGLDEIADPAKVSGKVRTAGEMMQQMNREAFMRLHEMGGTGSLLPDIEGTEHAPGFKHVERYLSPEIARALSPNQPPRLGRVSFGSQMGRTEVIRTVPTEIVNQILDSDVMRATPTGNLDDAAAEISRKFGNYLGRDEAYGFDPSKPLQGQVLDKSGHARELAEWASNHRKGRMFNNSRMDDFIKYQQGAQAQLKMYEVIHAFLEKNVLNKGEEGVTVRQAFRDAGMDSERAIKWRWKTKGAGGDTLEQFSKSFGESRVPVEVAAAIKAIQEPFRQADWMRNAGKFMDDVVNGTFKGMFTLPFPAFHGRNLIQGQYMNLAASGHIRTPGDVTEYASTLKDVMRQWQTGAAEAQQLAEEMTAWGALDKRSIAEGIETTGSAYRGVSAGPRSPLTDLAGSWMAADERIGQIQQDWPTPLLDAIPGVTRARVSGQTFMEEGGKLAAVTEWANRATLFSYLRKKGFTAEAAASEVRKMHADYGDLAPFEKVVMRRLIPFYAFQRRMAPVMFETLLDSPSGGLGQTIRALRQSRDDKDALMPDHVAQTTAIPLGGSEDGSKKYLTGFGFPFEQSFSYFDGGVRGGLREAASQLTPIIKAPLEYASGQTFFQAGSGGAGRSLNDLDPTVGRTLSNILGQAEPVDIGRTNEFILANSPLSRFLTVGRKLSDPRKSHAEKLASIGLGINTTDVSIAAQDAVLRDRASDFMREQGARSYERVYFPSWQIDQMENPAAQQQAQELNALQAVLSSRARRRAEAKQKNPLMQAAGR